MHIALCATFLFAHVLSQKVHRKEIGVIMDYRKERKKTHTTLSVEMTKALMNQIEEKAKKLDLSKSQYVRRVLMNDLNN